MAAAEALRDHFLGWQCRIRQLAMREDGGRPSPGMRPRLLTPLGRELAPSFTVLIVPKEPSESTAFFRFQVQRSRDPRETYERGLAFLQADHFQQPKSFSDMLSAVLPPGSQLARELLEASACLLEFDQFRQFYRLPCAVFALAPGGPVYEATVWHNRLFNPALPDDVQVLGFRPDWANAEARPAPRRQEGSEGGSF